MSKQWQMFGTLGALVVKAFDDGKTRSPLQLSDRLPDFVPQRDKVYERANPPHSLRVAFRISRLMMRHITGLPAVDAHGFFWTISQDANRGVLPFFFPVGTGGAPNAQLPVPNGLGGMGVCAAPPVGRRWA